MRTAMNEYPRDCSMWMEAFQAKYDGVGTFEKEQWDQLLGSHSVSPCSTREASCRFAYINAENSLYVTFQPSRLAQSSWTLILMPKLSSPIAPLIHGTIRVQRHCCKRGSTGCMGFCNISIGSLASYTHYGGSTGNVSLTTISSRMGKRPCARTMLGSGIMRKRPGDQYWNLIWVTSGVFSASFWR